MNIIVTGGLGFIGSHLVDSLILKGHRVVVIDNECSGKLENLNPKAEFRSADIRFKGYVDVAFQDVNPDIVFHLAAVSRTPWAIEDPLYTYQTNVVGSANVLQAAKEAGAKKVVLASSNIVYAAQTPYKTSKLAMEQMARDYNDLYDLPTLCLRFSNVYGSERQHADNVLAALAKSKREKGKITIMGDGEQTRNFTHVFDVCEALIQASGLMLNVDASIEYNTLAYYNPRGDEIDIMHPRAWTLNDVAKFFDCPIEYVAERRGDIKHLQMTGPEKATELIGFTATRNLEDHIQLYTAVHDKEH